MERQGKNRQIPARDFKLKQTGENIQGLFGKMGKKLPDFYPGIQDNYEKSQFLIDTSW